MCNGTFVCTADAVRLRKSTSVTSFFLTIRADMLWLGGRNRAVSHLTCSWSTNSQIHFGTVVTSLCSVKHDILLFLDGCLRVEFCATKFSPQVRALSGTKIVVACNF